MSMDREDLIRALDDAEATDLAVLKQAAENAKAAYLKASNTANLKSWKGAEQAVEDYMARKAEEKGDQGAEAKAGAASAAARRRVFESLNQVCGHLQAEGWQVCYNTLRKAVKDGRLKPRKDGRYTQWAADQYAAGVLKRRLPEGGAEPEESAPPAPSLGEEKTREDIELRKVARERERLKLDKERGNLIPRELYEKDLAARLALFSNSLDAWFSRVAGEVAALLGADLGAAERIIALVGGDPGKALELVGHVQACEAEVLDLLLSRKHEWLRAFARSEVQVVDIEPYLGLVRGEGGRA